MKQILKSRENPVSAPTQIQYQYPSTNMPLSLRRAFPTVGSGILRLMLGCAKNRVVYTNTDQVMKVEMPKLKTK